MQVILNETEYAEYLTLKEQNSELSHELAVLSAKAHEMERDFAGISSVLEETKKISAKRLEVVNSLTRIVRNLKTEHVCIATNPQNGHVKVISVGKADTYRKFGWIVSEEYLVDRPA